MTIIIRIMAETKEVGLASSTNSTSTSNSSSSDEDCTNSELFLHTQVPADARENYILSGYRPVQNDLSTCIKSAFSLHNETLNIWTHALPLAYFLYFGWLDAEFWIDPDLQKAQPGDQVYPLYGYMLGICVLFATSTGAHLLSCASWRWRNVCFMLDYAAISLYGISAANAYYYYNTTNSWLLVLFGETVFLTFIMMAATVAAGACCWTRVYNSPLSHLIRTSAFSLPFLIGSSPVVSRFLATCSLSQSATDLAAIPLLPYHLVFGGGSSSNNGTSAEPDGILDQEAVFRTRYLRHFGFLAAGAIVNVSKVPERWFPGMFDVIGHSHQWFHVLIFFGIREQFWLMVADATKTQISTTTAGDSNEELHPAAENSGAGATSLGMLFFAMAMLVTTVVAFSILMKCNTAEPVSTSAKKKT